MKPIRPEESPLQQIVWSRFLFVLGVAALLVTVSHAGDEPANRENRLPAPIAGQQGTPEEAAVLDPRKAPKASAQVGTDESALRERRHAPPAPKGTVPPTQTSAAAPPSPGAVLGIPSPQPSCVIHALADDNRVIPPDTHGAVGRDDLVVFLNTEVRILERNGVERQRLTLDAFWAPVNGVDPFDPRVFYDPFADRFIAVAVAARHSPASSVLVGVSQSGDPTLPWSLYRIDADAANRSWADFPSVGFNGKWVVVQINMFDNDDRFDRGSFFVFDKQNLYSGGDGRFTRIEAGNYGGWISPAVTYDPDLEDIFLIDTWSDTFGMLQMYRITGEIGAEQFSPVTLVDIGTTWAPGPPNWEDFAPQLGTFRKIQTNSSNMHNVVYRDGSLWCTHTAFLPGGTPTRSSVHWYELDPAGTVLQFGRIDDPSGEFYRAFPSIAVNARHDALLGFSSFSAGQYAAASYAWHAAEDAAGDTRRPFDFQPGRATYYKTFGESDNRWGDYSMTVVDPVDDEGFWTIQEYAARQTGGSSRWGTQWAYVTRLPRDNDVDGIPDACDLDDDADGIRDRVDNCRLLPNAGQADLDADGVGDLCDSCNDTDMDGVGDPGFAGNPCGSDNCPSVPNAGQEDFDDDGYGDQCEIGALLADVNLSGRVDGFDLATFARAFGASFPSDRYERRLDLGPRDGLIDGHDLLILKNNFGEDATPPTFVAKQQHSRSGARAGGRERQPDVRTSEERRIRLALEPTTAELTPGDGLEVRVVLREEREVGAVPFHLTFDPAVLRYENGEVGNLFEKTDASPIFLVSAPDGVGRVVAGLAVMGRGAGVHGSGTICILRFRAVGVGRTRLRFEATSLRDGDGKEIPITLGTSAVDVR